MHKKKHTVWKLTRARIWNEWVSNGHELAERCNFWEENESSWIHRLVTADQYGDVNVVGRVRRGVWKFSAVWWLRSGASEAHCAEKFDYMSPEASLSPFTAEGACNGLLHLSLQSAQSETDEHTLPPSGVCTREENVSSKKYLVMEKWCFEEEKKGGGGHVLHITFHFMFKYGYQSVIFLPY